MSIVSTSPEDVVESEGTPLVPLVSDGFRRYALVLLLAVYTVNFLDRQIVSILAEPIKRDLKLSDTQLGLLTGLAFAIFYTFLGLPIARLAERSNRVTIIGVSLAVWSGFTVVCGLATNYAQLLLARIGVGVGEAGCTPTAHSLIADYVPKSQRASALAFFAMGTPLGSLLGSSLGGVMSDTFGWRTAFLLAGVPGLLLTAVVFLTLREPRKQLSEVARARMAETQKTEGSFAATLTYLARKRSFWLVAFGAATLAFIGYGNGAFVYSFYLRNHPQEVAELAGHFGLKSVGFLGLVLGILGGVMGVLSSWLGGVLADRAGARDIRAYMTVPAVAALISPVFAVIGYLQPTAIGTMLVMLIPGLVGSLWYGPVYASGQSLVPPHMRATAASVLLFIINLVGLGAGPLIVGALSDLFAHALGMGEAEGVRWAIITTSCCTLIAAGLFWRARKTIREDLVS
ncbi:MAG: spinster family MFS transporter [Phenylobacterium sp.]